MGPVLLFASLLVLFLSFATYAEERSDPVRPSVQPADTAGAGDRIAPQKQTDGNDKTAAQKPDDKPTPAVKKPAGIPPSESDSRIRNNVSRIDRTSQKMNRTMRSLNNTIRDMNTQINRIRNLDRRLQSIPRR